MRLLRRALVSLSMAVAGGIAGFSLTVLVALALRFAGARPDWVHALTGAGLGLLTIGGCAAMGYVGARGLGAR